MSLVEAIAVLLAGAAAGTINVIVGSGTLVTFPVLLALGYPPLTANVSNTVGLVPGSVAGAVGYRRELRDHGRRIAELGTASATGGLVGAVLLLTLPESAFDVIVPVLVALAVVLVAVQPWLSKKVGSRAPDRRRHEGPILLGAISLTGVYGGYFGAAQGVILLGVMGLALSADLQEINGIKNVLAGLVNAVAAVVFVFSADVAWLPVVLIAVGSALGGTAGAKIARRLPRTALRGVVVVVGTAALVQLLR
ncbi:MAG: sulfite exporter TauE/SafE family protein [Thermoleophilaceae bacterium]